MIYLPGRKVKVQFMLIIIIIVLDMIFWLTKNLHFHSKYLHKPKRGFISIFVLFFFINFIYGLWALMSLNYHKMAKNALNELIFGPDMYFYGFYQFQKGF